MMTIPLKYSNNEMTSYKAGSISLSSILCYQKSAKKGFLKKNSVREIPAINNFFKKRNFLFLSKSVSK